jgi:GT2 family glycosyltransferase
LEQVINYIIICTKNREESLLQLIKSVELSTQSDYKIIIVDSSDTKSRTFEEKINNNIEYFWRRDLNLIEAREFSIGIIQKNSNLENSIIYFLDDDCEVESNYFDEIRKTFIDKKNIVGVTGFNTHFYLWDSVMKRIILSNKLFKKLQGRITFGAIGIGVYEQIGVAKVSWLPGFSMAFAGSSARHIEFCHELRKFNCIGEDLFMSTRLLKYGDLYVNTNARLRHHPDPVNREKNKFKIRYIQFRVWYLLKNRI